MLNRSAVGGIIGKLSFDASEPLARPVLEQMLDTVARRTVSAPGSGFRDVYTAPGLALGWCADVDETAPGAAGAATADAGVRAVADARLTNARDIRSRLSREGHRFTDGSDAELIAHAYEQWGTRFVARLRGPFAFALWDDRRRRLVLGRDHLGIRPLYFALLPGHGVVFASDLRALFCEPGVTRDWCATGIDAYLALGYVPAPLTAFRRVSKLEPAQLLLVEGRRLHVEQYWDLPPALPHATMSDIVSGVEHRLRAAVRDQLQDGTVNGILYSGGTASSALLAALPRSGGMAVTVGLDQDTSDLARSHEAGTVLGRTPEIEIATPDLPVLAAALAAHFDEPVADPSAVAQFATCVAARAHIDCALTAHGTAALWAGYAWHRRSHVPSLTHGDELWGDIHRRRLYTRAFAWQVREANPIARHLELYASRDGGDAVDRALYVDTRTFLPDSLLAVAQRSAHAAGLRLRFPFLDKEFAEFSATVPAALKQHGSTGMRPLREALARRLPSSLMPSPCRPPQHAWLPGTVAAMVPKILLARRFDGRGIVSRPALATLWEEHRAGRRDHAHRLWSLLMLEFWFREYIDGDAVEEPTEYAVLKAA